MSDPKDHQLRLSHRLGIILALLNRKPLRPLLDALSIGQLVAAHAFLWDKLVELHCLTQRGNFVREDVTRQMISSSAYQRQQGCDLRLDYCKGVECIWSNPDCAGNKVKANMEVMAGVIGRYLVLPANQAPAHQSTHEEVKTWY